MSNNVDDDGRGYERHQKEVSEAIDGGGCAETWETLSGQRARRDDAADDRRPDIEGTLLDIDCLQFTGDGEDFEVVPSFRNAWRAAIDELDDENVAAVLADVFDVDGTVRIDSDERAVYARHDGQSLAQWVSRSAMVADLAACRVFERQDDDWEERSPVERSRLAGGVRLYLEFCPDCGGRTSFDTETVTSCCNDYEVATVSCEDCDEILLEIPIPSGGG
ncbi:hypothetical protein [Halorhabdus amylolytica]|uniref:hypothetical protein n=1 Tax=Halorhabdus amylolytica TaxID=2559573 RepID=UPI0010A9ED38|nr:hypothetical protein [Halorhabdus amylolytica]